MGEIASYSALVVVCYMTTWFVIAQIKKRNDIADIAWGIGFFTLTLALYLRQNASSLKAFILLCMVGVWAIRLATHIAVRQEHKPEDARYVAMRQKWKYEILQAYTNVFLAQGIFLLMVSAPIIIYFTRMTTSISLLNIGGLVLWSIGLFFEAVGDYQLARFLKNPKNKGKIMRYGLWKFTRHPNYFGEISLWWGLWLFTGFGTGWIFGILGPTTITVLILGISGIPMLEKRYKGNKEYEQYQKTTSAFFPMRSKNLK